MLGRRQVFFGQLVTDTSLSLFNTPATALVNGGIAEWVEPDKAISWPKVMNGNDVPDFTTEVAKVFKQQVDDHFVMIDSGQVEPFDQSADFSRLTTKYDADYIVEIRTLFGSFSYGPLAWQTYALKYSADLVVVRASDQKPVWKLVCGIGPEDNNPLSVPGADFLSGEGEKLRAAAAYATSYCGQQLAQQFLMALAE